MVAAWAVATGELPEGRVRRDVYVLSGDDFRTEHMRSSAISTVGWPHGLRCRPAATGSFSSSDAAASVRRLGRRRRLRHLGRLRRLRRRGRGPLLAPRHVQASTPTQGHMSGCDRTDIEAMKEDRRQKAAAKRAAAGPEDETAPAAAEPAQVFDAPVMAGPLKQLSDAEAKADAIAADIATATADATAASDKEAVEKLSVLAANIGGRIGGLQGLMDEVDLGELDDEARGAARLRRKAINARVEAELEPAAQALKVHVKAQASRVA